MAEGFSPVNSLSRFSLKEVLLLLKNSCWQLGDSCELLLLGSYPLIWKWTFGCKVECWCRGIYTLCGIPGFVSQHILSCALSNRNTSELESFITINLNSLHSLTQPSRTNSSEKPQAASCQLHVCVFHRWVCWHPKVCTACSLQSPGSGVPGCRWAVGTVWAVRCSGCSGQEQVVPFCHS